MLTSNHNQTSKLMPNGVSRNESYITYVFISFHLHAHCLRRRRQWWVVEGEGKRINTLILNRIFCRNYTRKRKAQIHFIITRENEDIYPSMRNQYSSVFWFSDNGSDIFHPLRVSSTLSYFCLRRSR